MHLSSELIDTAITNAARGHRYKPEVIAMLADRDAYVLKVFSAIETGKYATMLRYREFETRNSNGKLRHIESPDLFTRVLQHVFILLIGPLYREKDPDISFNCKKGYGVASNNPRNSLSHRIKNIIYDRRDLHYALHVDQRRCYPHMSPKLLRTSLKNLTGDRELIDFGVNVTFNGKSFPIGTPTSPLAHHIIMLAFDRWLGSIPRPKFRYADDTVLFFRTKEDANAAKWRIRNFWWYVYGVFAKRNPAIVDIDRSPLSFCGQVYRRSPDKDANGHGKGYSRPRTNIRKAARECRSDTSWASYFGILSKTDSFKTMETIEERMNFSELTAKIKISREFDAEPISVAELAKSKFDIYDFELMYGKDKETGQSVPNWVRLLVGVAETNDAGEATGNYLRYCTKTEANGIVAFMAEVRRLEESGEKVMPIMGCELENAAGFMFRGSTNREKYCTRDNIRLPKSSVRKPGA